MKIKTYKKLIIYLCTYLITNIYSYHNKSNLNKSKISVFLPIYNKELYINDCIRSLQNQTFKNIEIIAVNDGSTDNSLKILKKLSKKDQRIKIINNDRNHGLLYSRAMGISNSTGEYLMNLDPDDKLSNNNDLSTLYKYSKNKKYDLITFLIKRIPTNKKDVEFFKYLDETQLNRTDWYITNKLVRKEIFMKAFHEFKEEIFDERWNYHEDNIWNYLVRKFAKSIKILDKYIYYYKKNKDSLSVNKDSSIEIKNRIERLRKFTIINNNSKLHLSSINFIEHHAKYNLIKKNELKNHIFHTFITYMDSITKNDNIYNIINLFLNKLSEPKLIIFYYSTNETSILHTIKVNLLNKIIMEYKYIIPINCKNMNYIKGIKKFIFSKDVFILLNNAIFECDLTNILKFHKKNKIFAFMNKEYKRLKIFYFRNKKYN